MTDPLFSQINLETGAVVGKVPNVRLLEGMRGLFLDEEAFDQALTRQGNVPVYSVTGVEPADGDGQLHFGIGIIYPGKIGHEYYFTAGHYHAYRPAAELYIGFSGEGFMLLQDEHSEETRVLPLFANAIVYVPGYTAHRTVNTGTAPLIYIGIYPAQAGHDYGAIKEKNFNKVVLEIDSKPMIMDRQAALGKLKKER